MKIFSARLVPEGASIPVHGREEDGRLAARLRAALSEADFTELVMVIKGGQTARLVVISESDADLLAPWDRVSFPETGPLGACETLHIARAPAQDSEDTLPEAPKQGHVLLVASDAGGAVPTSAVQAELDGLLSDGPLGFCAATDILPNPTLGRLARELHSRTPVVVQVLGHFVGNGSVGTGLILDSPADDADAEGTSHLVMDAATLGSILRPLRKTLRAVFLTPIDSHVAEEAEADLGQFALDLQRAGVPAVVTPNYPLGPDAVLRYTAELYTAVGRQFLPIEVAVGAAITGMHLRRDSTDADTPSSEGDSNRTIHAFTNPQVASDAVLLSVDPFVGPLPITSRQHLYGRDAELQSLTAMLRSMATSKKGRIGFVRGEAGVGRTSLLRCSLPKLVGSGFESIHWCRGHHALREQLSELLLEAVTLEPPPSRLVVGYDLLADDGLLEPGVAHLLGSTLFAATGGPTSITVVLDISNADLLELGWVPYGAQGTFLSTLFEHPDHSILVERLGGESLREALTEATRLGAVTLAPDLMDALLLRHAQGVRDSLAQIQMFLLHQWKSTEARAWGRSRLTTSGDDLNGMIDTCASAWLASLDEAHQEAAKVVLRRLLAGGVVADSVFEGLPAERVQQVLQLCVDQRLVEAVDHSGTRAYQLSTALVRNWRLLRRWRMTAAVEQARLAELERWAHRYQLFGDEALLEGDRLAYARWILSQAGIHDSPHVRSLIAASEAREQEARLAPGPAPVEAAPEAAPDAAEAVVTSEAPVAPEPELKPEPRSHAAPPPPAAVVSPHAAAAPPAGRPVTGYTALLFLLFLVALVLWKPMQLEQLWLDDVASAEALLDGDDAADERDGSARDAALVQQATTHPEPHVAAELLRQVKQPAETAGWQAAADVVTRSRAPSLVLRGHRAPVASLDLATDGDQLLSSAMDGTVRIWSVLGHAAPVAIPSGTAQPRTVARLPKERGVLTLSSTEAGIETWSLTGDGPQQLLAGNSALSSVAVDGAGSVYVGWSNGVLTRMSIDDNTVSEILFKGRTPIVNIAVAPDTSALAFSDANAHVRSMHPDGSRLRTVVRGNYGGTIVAYSEASTRLLTYSAGASTARVWSTDRNRFVGEVTGLDGPVAVAGLTDGDQRIYVGTTAGSVVLWDLASESSVATWKPSEHAVQAAAMDSSARMLAVATADGATRLYGADASDQPYLLDTGGIGSTVLQFSADGRLLLVGGVDGSIRVWQTARPTTPPPPASTPDDLHKRLKHHSVRCLDAQSRMKALGESHSEARKNAHACRVQRHEQARTDRKNRRQGSTGDSSRSEGASGDH